MTEIDNRKMWLSILENPCEGNMIDLIRGVVVSALKDQGLEYYNGDFRKIEVTPKFKVGQYIIHVDDGQDILWQPHKVIQVDEIDKKYRLADGCVVHFSEQDEYEVTFIKPMKEKEFDIELTDFEKELANIIGFAISTATVSPSDDIRTFTKEYAPSLLIAARKQLENEVAMMPSAPSFSLSLVGLERELDQFFVNRCDMYRMRATKEEKRTQLNAYATRIRNIITNEADEFIKKGILAINQVSYNLGYEEGKEAIKKEHEAELERAYKNADEVQYKHGYEVGYGDCRKEIIDKFIDKVDIDEMVSGFNPTADDTLESIYRKGIEDTLRFIKGE